MYAKMLDGNIFYAPNPILHNGSYMGNPPQEVYKAEGYKPVTYTDQPAPPGSGWFVETWSETDDAIVQGWEWHETTDEDEISPEEAMEILMGGEGV